jgi:hypothetical protein
MSDETSFRADASDIRSLLTGTDPTAEARGDDVGNAMSLIRDAIAGTGIAAAGPPPMARAARRWWPSRPSRRRVRRRLVVVYAAIPALVAATGGAWVVASSNPPSGNVLCYSSASLHPNGILEGELSPSQAPVAFCAHVWAIGAVTGDRHSSAVPPLVACVVTNVIGVFPHTSCGALALRPPSARYLKADRAAVSSTISLAGRLTLAARVHERQRKS